MTSIYELADLMLRCEQPGYCDGADTHGRNAVLNEEECEAPARCALCHRKLCDMCAAGVKIPKEEFIRRGMSALGLDGKEHDAYDGFVCSEDFNEDWV